MKKNKKILCIIVVLLVFITSMVYCISKFSYDIVLIQLSPQTESQMMGYIIVTQNKKVIVVDGGTKGDSQNLISYIEKYGGKVDYYFITHHHNDHAGALCEIIKNTEIEIDNIYISLNEKSWYQENEPERVEFSVELIDLIKNSRVSEKVIEPKVNDEIYIDNIKIKILGIKNPEILQNCGNNQSMVFKVYCDKNEILFLGDTGIESQKKLIENQYNELKSSIVQISHHGQDGTNFEFYEIVNPKICLFPTPEWLWNNDNGNGEDSGPWKIKETRKWIEILKIQEIYVAKDGDIELKIK